MRITRICGINHSTEKYSKGMEGMIKFIYKQ